MILCVGLSPTVQRTLRFAHPLALGDVNRASDATTTASGKAVNVARVAAALGAEVLLVHPLGGDTGARVRSLLDTDRVPQVVAWDDGAPTRTCTTLLAGPTTELVEEASPVTTATLDTVRNAVIGALDRATALCLSGSLPGGVSPAFLVDLARAARERNVPVLCDTQRAPLSALLGEKPWLVKPNLDEARATLSLSADSGALGAAAALRDAGAEWALVSEGKRGAVLSGPDGDWRLLPPHVDVLNAIGSGDSLAAGVLVGRFFRGWPMERAAALGTAAGAANCLSLTSGVVDPEEVDRLLPQVRVVPL